MYAPWVRSIFIVTNGQIPAWLNRNNPKVSIISHSEIFAHSYDLPCFNSNAIEANIHKIKNLSTKFIYFNDDFALARPVCLSNFWTKETGYKLILGSEIARNYDLKDCPKDCLTTYYADGICDEHCNKLTCVWDGNDCDAKEPDNQKPDGRIAWLRSVQYVNVLYDRNLINEVRWTAQDHIPIMLNRHIMTELQTKFSREFAVTSAHKIRRKNDMNFQFSYVGWLMQAPRSAISIDIDLYNYTTEEKNGRTKYVGYFNEMWKNLGQLESLMKMTNENLTYYCINDLMDHSEPEAATAKFYLEQFYETMYPQKSSFEV